MPTIDGLHVFGLQPLEHARVASWQQGQIGLQLVFHQGLIEAAVAGEHLLGGVHDPVLEPQQQIEVAQAEVGVEHGGAHALPGQGDAQVGGERGFSHAPLA